jgi:hypothetical protein
MKAGASDVTIRRATDADLAAIDDSWYAAEAVHWARPRATTLRITVPGPHPALGPLLEAGFQITYVEMFVSMAAQPFMDAACYIPASSTLF